MSFLQIDKVCKSFGPINVLRDITLDVEEGGFTSGGYVKRSPTMAKMEIVSSTNTKNNNDQSKFRF